MDEREPTSLLVIIFLIFLCLSYYIYHFVESKVNYDKVEETISENTSSIDTNSIVEKVENNEDDYIGILQIPKISLERVFYKIDSINNNVEKNIQVLNGSDMPDKDNGTLIIAAHSGNSYISFFKDLNKIELDDKIYVYYKNKIYLYYVEKIYDEIRNGKINIDKNINDTLLVLTTCKDNDKQLIVIAKRCDNCG